MKFCERFTAMQADSNVQDRVPETAAISGKSYRARKLRAFRYPNVDTSSGKAAWRQPDNHGYVYITENALGNGMRIGETEMLTLMGCLHLDSLWSWIVVSFSISIVVLGLLPKDYFGRGRYMESVMPLLSSILSRVLPLRVWSRPETRMVQ